MVKLGYKLNPKTGDYERKVSVNKKNGKKEVTITAAKLPNEQGNVYYSCSPEVNGEYMFLGFLSRSSDTGACVPCCFKKDPSKSKNKYRRNFHMQCMGKQVANDEFDKDDIGDKLYILQDTNKMLPGRYGYLNKYLDYYFNSVLNKEKVIKSNYLIETTTGYYMKFGSKQDVYPYLNAISACLNMSYETIVFKIKKAVEDKSIWTSNNSGDSKTQFENIENYILTLETNEELDYQFCDDVISIPGVLLDEGLNVYIFEKKELNSKVDFVLLCKNLENIIYYHDPLRKNIILVKENLNYYPIMLIHKGTKDKNISVKSVFDKNDECIQHIMNYMNLSCNSVTFEESLSMSAKKTYYSWFAKNEINKLPSSQFIDTRNKCTFLICDNFPVPVKPSGALYHLPISNTLPIPGLMELIDFLRSINNIVPMNIMGFVYDTVDNGNYKIINIICNDFSIEIEPIQLSDSDMDNIVPGYVLRTKTLYDEIDQEIKKGPSNVTIDDRIKSTKQDNYKMEHYELFRYELSHFLNMSVNIKKKIQSILESKSQNKQLEIKNILLKALSDDLYSKVVQSGGSAKFITLDNEPINTENYEIKNNRELCSQHKTKNDCSQYSHCSWNKHCSYRVSEKELLYFVSRVSSELVYNEMKSKELLNIDEYYVLDVIDINNYTYREGQKIIKSDNININKILGEMFGKANIPTIGKKRLFKANKSIHDENTKFPLEKIGDTYYQQIITTNSLFRAYSNSIYWIKNNMSDPVYRNLGYYSVLQTELSNTFKSFVYSTISNERKMRILYEKLDNIINLEYQSFYDEYRTKIFLDINYYYLGIVDLLILNTQHKIPIMLYNNYDSLFLIIDDTITFNNIDGSKENEINDVLRNYDLSKCIKIKYKIPNITINSIPEHVFSVY